MDDHVEAELEDYALGTLEAAERPRVTTHVTACPSCAAALSMVEDAVNVLSTAMPSVARVRHRIEAQLMGPGRFAHFKTQLATLFDLAEPAVDALLARVDAKDGWEGGLARGVEVLTVEAGPKREGFMTALVRVDAGAEFPEHGHGAEEQVLVLEGGYLDSTGVEVWRGELDVRQPGTSHSFTALPDAPCLCASVSRPPE